MYKKIALLAIVWSLLLLSGCVSSGSGSSSGNPADALIQSVLGNQPLGRTIEGLSYTEVHQGIVWDKPYRIRRTPSGRYVLVSNDRTRVISNSGPMTAVYTVRTGAIGLDAFLTSDSACPYRYVTVTGSSSSLNFQALGCGSELSFERGGRDKVFATETRLPEGSEPLAYELSAHSAGKARPVSKLPDHPQYLAYQQRRPGTSRSLPQRAVKPTAKASVAAAVESDEGEDASASALRRLPPPESINLPDDEPAKRG